MLCVVSVLARIVCCLRRSISLVSFGVCSLLVVGCRFLHVCLLLFFCRLAYVVCAFLGCRVVVVVCLIAVSYVFCMLVCLYFCVGKFAYVMVVCCAVLVFCCCLIVSVFSRLVVGGWWLVVGGCLL